MTTPAQLRAMSDAATQGEWGTEKDDAWQVTAANVDNYVPWVEPWVVARMIPYMPGDAEAANAAFIAALVNAYRSGVLVHRDDVAETLRAIIARSKRGTFSTAQDRARLAKDALAAISPPAKAE